MPGHAIFINGIQAAGKSTVAAKMRGRMRRPRTVHTDDQIIAVRNAHSRRGLEADPIRLSDEAWLATLSATREALLNANVLVEGTMTARHAVEARAMFGDQAMFAILRIKAETRARRQDDRDRAGRPLGTPWTQDGHDMPGPDDLYDLVIDADEMSAKSCAQEILTFAAERWPDARL